MIGHRPRPARLHLPARARRRHRGRSSSRTATRTTSARCRWSCASSGARHPPVFGGPLTMAMARSKLDEHRLKEVEVERRRRRASALELGPFDIELIHMTHSIPDACAVALHDRARGRCSITGDYKFDQTPVDGVPADVARLAELGREGLLLLCGDSTNADRPGFSPSESIVGPEARGGLRALRGAHRRHELRLEHPPRPAGRRRRRGARPQGRARRPLDAQERQHRPLARATSTCPRACSCSRARSRTSPTTSS